MRISMCLVLLAGSPATLRHPLEEVGSFSQLSRDLERLLLTPRVGGVHGGSLMCSRLMPHPFG